MLHHLTRKEFLTQMGILGTSALFFQGCHFSSKNSQTKLPVIQIPEEEEGIFQYINRIRGTWDQTLYRQLIGAANEFKEGDLTLGIAAESESS